MTEPVKSLQERDQKVVNIHFSLSPADNKTHQEFLRFYFFSLKKKREQNKQRITNDFNLKNHLIAIRKTELELLFSNTDEERKTKEQGLRLN
jgi:hypothetical protein